MRVIIYATLVTTNVQCNARLNHANSFVV